MNNALCSWLLRHHGLLETDDTLSAQAGCATGWRDPQFAVTLHSAFLDLISSGARISTPDTSVSLSRFSINCLGFFGEEVQRLGSKFCPPGVDDEEWLSASLPLKEGRVGRIVGTTCVAHYSFFTQEAVLNATNILDRYYDLAGLRRQYPLPLGRRIPLREKLKRIAKSILHQAGIQINRSETRERNFRLQAPSDRPPTSRHPKTHTMASDHAN